MLVDKQTYFENHNHQKKIYHENNLNKTIKLLGFILLCFCSVFAANVASFVFKSEFSTRLKISN